MILRRQFIFFILLQGCVSIPDHELATVSTKIEKDQLVTHEWPNQEWWLEYEDPTLNSLINETIANNPSLKIAEERLKNAAQITHDNYQHFSKYGFFGSIAKVVPAEINDITLNLTYRGEIDFWEKQRDILNEAIGEVKARAAEVDAAKLILITSIAYDYYELQFMLRKKEILEAQHRNDQAILNIRSSRVSNGLDTALEILAAQIDSLNIEASIEELNAEIKNQIHEIKELSGMGLDAPLCIPVQSLKTSMAKLPENLSLDLIARRPDLTALKERMGSAAKIIGVAKTDFYPSVNLVEFAGLKSLNWTTIFNAANFNRSLQPAVHLPIFTECTIKAQMTKKVAEFNQAVEAYNALILAATKDVTDQINNLIKIDREIQARTAAFVAAANREAIVQKRIDYAVDDQIALLQIRNHYLDMKLTLTQLEYGKQLANILLIRSLGGGTRGRALGSSD